MPVRFEDCVLGFFDFLGSKEVRRILLSLVRTKLTTKKREPQWALSKLMRSSEMTYGRSQTMPPEWKGHKIGRRIIVYHEADKAGPHIDTYLEIDGVAYSVGVKRLTPEHLSNITKRNGQLTERSKQYIASVIGSEYRQGAWLAQSTTHTPEEARTEWSNNAYNGVYGAGPMRQVISDIPVSVFSTGDSIEFRDWELNPDTNAYVFRIMDTKAGVRSKAILKLGYKKPINPKVQDRLHLKPHIGTHEFERFKRMVGDNGIVTIKHDGASFYFESTNKGTRFYSPRISKVDGNRINYDAKVKDLIHITSEEKITGMGELNYIKNGKILSAHETGGILNSNSPLPIDIEPQLTIYRIDTIGRSNVYDLSYRQNLGLIRSFVEGVTDNRVRTPTIVSWDNAKDIAQQEEGLVGIPNDLSIINGRKYKPRGDTFDWTVDKIELIPGLRGGIAGVVRFTGESGKQFKIGASSMGNREFVEELMSKPQAFEGRVAKVSCYSGHEGRAPRFVAWHPDKGSG